MLLAYRSDLIEAEGKIPLIIAHHQLPGTQYLNTDAQFQQVVEITQELFLLFPSQLTHFLCKLHLGQGTAFQGGIQPVAQQALPIFIGMLQQLEGFAVIAFRDAGDYVSVEGVGGFDVGEVSLTGELVRLQLKKKGVDEQNPEMKKILRRASERDIETFKISKGREKEILARSRAIAKQLNLQMKLSEVEIQADGKKGTFFYTADDRVDFRELIKIYAGDFKVKVEMRQIGIRQEAAKVGGIGSCGRELCCSTWLNDFKSVNTTAARYQNLSINQTKLSGQCGRLKCCLNYELDTYLDALQHFPDYADSLETVMGTAQLVKKDIFKNLMWYSLPNNTKHYPLTIQRVKEIKRMNQQGQKAEELQAVEISGNKQTETETAFVELVGQISLRTLEKNDRRRRDQQKNQQRQQQEGRNGGQQKGPRQQGQGQRPQAQGQGGQQNQNRPPQQGNQGGQRPQQKQRPQGGQPNRGGGGQGQKPPQNPNQQPPKP